MVGRAESQLAKDAKTSAKKDAAKKQAADEYRAELEKPKELRKGAEMFALKYGVSKSTILRLSKPNAQTILDFNDTKNNLGQTSRMLLKHWILSMADRALPCSRKLVKEKANMLIQATENPNFDGVSDSWVDRFFASPLCDDLTTHWTSPLSKDRARAVNPNTIKSWFELVHRRIVEEEVKAENMYGMDEINFIEGMEHKTRVAGRKGGGNTYKRQGGSRKSLTVICTICADGSTLKPTIIFKGMDLQKRWGRINPIKANISRAKKGYTNKELGVSWIKDFDHQTHHKNDDRRVLFLDVHNSHYSLGFLEYAVQANIEVLGYWARTTHVAQGLDVACFGALKTNYGNEKDRFERLTGEEVNGGNFLQVYGLAHTQTFTPETVKAAFSKTGIHPFNRDAISIDAQAPSLELATEVSSFPVCQPTPVKRIIDAFRTMQIRPPTPESPTPAGKSGHNIDTEPTTPTKEGGLRTVLDSTHDMVSSLSLSSVSFLVSKNNPFTSAAQLPPPILRNLPKISKVTWENLLSSPIHERTIEEIEVENKALRHSLRNLRDLIQEGESLLESQNSQMVLQNMHLSELQKQLNHQEKKRRQGETEALLKTDMGRIWTSDQFMEALRCDDVRLRNEAVAAAIRGDKKLWMAEEKKRIDAEWQLVVADWEAKRDRIKADGKKTGWGRKPPKPKRADTPEHLKPPQDPSDDLDAIEEQDADLDLAAADSDD